MRTRPHRDRSPDDATNGCQGHQPTPPPNKNIHLASSEGAERGYPAYPLFPPHSPKRQTLAVDKKNTHTTRQGKKQRESKSRGRESAPPTESVWAQVKLVFCLPCSAAFRLLTTSTQQLPPGVSDKFNDPIPYRRRRRTHPPPETDPRNEITVANGKVTVCTFCFFVSQVRSRFSVGPGRWWWCFRSGGAWEHHSGRLGQDWIFWWKGQQKHAASSHRVAFAMLIISIHSSDGWMGFSMAGEAKSGAFRSPLASFLPSMQHAAVAGRVLGEREIDLGGGKELCSVSFACFFFFFFWVPKNGRAVLSWGWGLGGGGFRSGWHGMLGHNGRQASTIFYFPPWFGGWVYEYVLLPCCCCCTLSLFVGYTASLIPYSTLCRAYSI